MWAAISRSLLVKCLVECVGTMLLCFTVACAAGTGQALAAVAIGSTLMCAIYFGGQLRSIATLKT